MDLLIAIIIRDRLKLIYEYLGIRSSLKVSSSIIGASIITANMYFNVASCVCEMCSGIRSKALSIIRGIDTGIAKIK
jgi:hypothetical protein